MQIRQQGLNLKEAVRSHYKSLEFVKKKKKKEGKENKILDESFEINADILSGKNKPVREVKPLYHGNECDISFYLFKKV
jgi:hypothetical protein